HRRREQARREPDALARCRLPPGGGVLTLLRGELVPCCIQSCPQRVATRSEVALPAEARIELAVHAAAEQCPQVLVDVAVPAGPVGRTLAAGRVVSLDEAGQVVELWTEDRAHNRVGDSGPRRIHDRRT